MNPPERRAIPGYEGLYEVDVEGSIYSLERIVIGPQGRAQLVPAIKRKLSKHGTGYLTVRLANQGVVRTHRVHRLVALAFIPNPSQLPDVNHKNGDKHNNRVVNLEWCDPKQNMEHAAGCGLTAKGFRNSGSKLTPRQVSTARLMVFMGDPLQEIAQILGVNRNTVPKALDRVFGYGWRVDLKPQYNKSNNIP